MGGQKQKFYTHKPGTTTIIGHEFTTRRAGAELLKRVDVVQMEVSTAVARTSSRAARPCAADATPPSYTHVQRRKHHALDC